MISKPFFVELKQARAMLGFLRLHLLENFRRRRIVASQTIGKITENARVLFFQRNRQSKNLAFGQVLETLGHVYSGYSPPSLLDTT
jgi:hypothetical protein